MENSQNTIVGSLIFLRGPLSFLGHYMCDKCWKSAYALLAGSGFFKSPGKKKKVDLSGKRFKPLIMSLAIHTVAINCFHSGLAFVQFKSSGQ